MLYIEQEGTYNVSRKQEGMFPITTKRINTMSINTNFDRSSTGLSISFTCLHDTDYAGVIFNENFITLEGGQLLYVAGDSTEFSEDFLTDMDNYTVNAHTAAAVLHHYLEDLIEINSEDPLDTDSQEKYSKVINEANEAELKKIISDVFEFRDYGHRQKANILGMLLTVKALIVTATGYCQGDSHVVVIPDECISRNRSDYEVRRDMERLIFDCPYYWSVDIRQGESETITLSGNELDMDPYEWDSEKITDKIVEVALAQNEFISEKLLRDQLADLVPVSVS